MKQLLLLLFTVAISLSCQQGPSKATMPNGISYLARESWGANAPVLPMQSHTLSRITIHHTATRQAPNRALADKMLALQKFSQEESPLANGKMKPVWADIPYHLYIDCHGAVAQGREMDYAGDSNTSYDPTGHLLIVLEGNFEAEEVTAAQLQTLEALVAHMAKRHKVAAVDIGGHKDFAQTACPGKKLYERLPHLQNLVLHPELH